MSTRLRICGLKAAEPIFPAPYFCIHPVCFRYKGVAAAKAQKVGQLRACWPPSAGSLSARTWFSSYAHLTTPLPFPSCEVSAISCILEPTKNPVNIGCCLLWFLHVTAFRIIINVGM
ncbi:hypothetical protein ABBQ38_011786 [Trebouxia sp. C0009 RCD-2024]